MGGQRHALAACFLGESRVHPREGLDSLGMDSVFLLQRIEDWSLPEVEPRFLGRPLRSCRSYVLICAVLDMCREGGWS